MKIIVSQIGARHRYLIPKILHKSGLLKFLYTDLTSNSFVTKLASLFILFFKNQKLKRLSQRNTKLPENKVKSSHILFIKSLFIKDKMKYIDNQLLGLSNKMIKWGVADADVLYNMFIENIDFADYCKKNGLVIYSDIYESITTYEDMVSEVEDFKSLVSSKKWLDYYKLRRDFRRIHIPKLIKLTDIYVVPSNFVKKGLIENYNIHENKIKLVPYGNSITFKEVNKPVFGRILWVGNDPFRKGLTYLTQAFNRLNLEFPLLEIRVAGITDIDVINDPFFKEINFLGKLTKDDLMKEYLTADLFVLPTISEGLVGAVIEAAAAGCPIITTVNSGVDEVLFPGLLCEPRNVDEIVHSIKSLIDDRSKRNKMSKDMISYAKMFSTDNYQSRIIELFN